MRQVVSGPVQAQSGQWWAGDHGGQSLVKCDWVVVAEVDEGGDCLKGRAGGCVAVAAEEAAVGGWPEHVGEGCHLVWGFAHRQVVHGGGHSPGTPGCRSSHPFPLNCLLHLCLPSGVEDGPVGVVHDGLVVGQQREDPDFVEAQEKSGVGLVLDPVAPQVVWA